MKCRVIVHPNNIISTEGIVVKGFGRGSKELGIRTANFDQNLVEQLPSGFPTGVYYGWAQVNDGQIFKCVINVGWCPYYQNKLKSFETHIMNIFENDFYGEVLRVVIAGYIREEMNFDNVDALIERIHLDIDIASAQLESQSNVDLKSSFRDLIPSKPNGVRI